MVTAVRPESGRTFVGRELELEVIGSLLRRARAGEFGALVVTGDAGVGKTRLVERACEPLAGGDALVVRGTCLPLTSMTVPLLPLRTALRHLPTDVPPPDLDRPAVVGAPLPVAVDDWLEAESARHPVVLVVDDLHWADESTLDVLMYAIAGVADRRLSILATLRRGEVTEGHPLQSWLADVRRLPAFRELALDPLDYSGTRDQLAALLGAPPHESLVSDVFSRSRGNPYLTRLLTVGVAPGDRHLGDDLPDDLRSAVLRAWHRLPAETRELVRVIAVGGEVAAGRALERAASLAGLGGDESVRLLRAAVEAGVLDVDLQGGYWFHHPLQAEALAGSLPLAERRRLHAAFARACEADLDGPGVGADPAERRAAVTVVADHHERSGAVEEAYRWALRAADAADAAGAAGEVGVTSEQLRLIRRAVELHEHVPNAGESRRDLLVRLRAAAERLGDFEQELGAVEDLLGLVDVQQDPLVAAELIVRSEHLRISTGRGFLGQQRIQQAVELSRHAADSWQHALALAELGRTALWQDDPQARRHLQAALSTARRSGHPQAMAYALAANAMLAVFEERLDEAAGLAQEAVEAAAEARDGWAFVHAALWEANALDTPVNPQWARLAQRRREQAEALGLPQCYVAWLSACEAGSWLYAGDVSACTERLRVALGSDPGAGPDVITRLVAARLAALQGRQAEAQAHLARAEELFAETSTFLAFEFDAVRATVRLGAGDLAGAVEAALSGATVEGAPPTMCEWLMPLAAQALADEAQEGRDAGRPVDRVLRDVDDLVRRFPHVIADSGGSTSFYLSEVAALDALYSAEVARARRDPGEVEAWLRTCDLLHGVLPWEEAYAAWRAGEAMLTRAHGRREGAAEMLRRARDLARRLGARPVEDEVLSLARSARIPLEEVHPPPGSDGVPPPLAGLTAREREILEHIVAGRTYGEIARALVLSEKTVSSHVSNLLRKTGAANRVDLARLATHAEYTG
ncbi:MAG TPA: AAA family ATPase [Pedococcus sp.]|uniref:helix-turn-helix transcriptional regulator n=1 Tax=Pedococcus sp. TaxID=2860345 RepID=UPI002F9260CF